MRKFGIISLLATLVVLAACGGEPRGPYLQNATDSSIVVRWRIADELAGTVRYGTDSNNLNMQASSPSGTSHEITLSGLQSGATYYYTTQSGNGAQSEVFSFKVPTATGSQAPFRVWILGDSGTADANAESVRDNFYSINGSSKTDLVLMLGDNAYELGSDAEYQKAVFDMYPETLATTPLWSTLGNHDAGTGNGSPYYESFTFPTQGEAGGVPSGTEAYYAFNYGNVHFVSLNSENIDRSVGGAMYNWLEADLQANTQDWTIVFFHHPPYSKGSHDSDTETKLVQMRENFVPLFDKYSVDMVFAGHSHSYERSYLVAGHTGKSTTLSSNMVLDSGDGRQNGDGAYEKSFAQNNNGAIYTVAGSSGKKSGGSLNHPIHHISMSELGSVILDFNGDQVTSRFISPNAQAQDTFTIVKY